VKVEVLTFEGCPNGPAATSLVRELAAELGVEVDLRETRVESPEEAARRRFLGSPTIRVDGRDVEPGADERTDYAFACRVYPSGGIPERDWIRDALLAGAG
jgi:Thioredoxin domain